MKQIKKKNLAILILILAIAPLISGYELNNTVIQTSSGNINITLTTPSIFFDSLTTESSYVYFENLRQTNIANDTINSLNITQDENVNGSALPYMSLETVVSNLSNNVTVNLTFGGNYACHRFVEVTGYTSSCSNGYIEVLNFNITNGVNTIPLIYNSEACQSGNDVINGLVIMIPIIIIFLILGGFFAIKNGTFGTISEDPGKILAVMGGIIMLCLILGFGLVIVSRIGC